MPRFYKMRWFLILLVSIILVVFISNSFFKFRYANPLEEIVVNILKPIHYITYSIGNFVNGSISFIAEIGSLRKTNQELLNRVTTLENDARRAKELEMENQRLKELLNFKEENKNLELVGARVIAQNPDNWFSVIVIDKGTDDVIKPGMPVLNSKGLIGQVTEVGNKWAKVTLLIDPSSSVSIVVSRTRDNGIAKGDLELSKTGRLKILYLPSNSDISINDDIVTSGLGGVFPKGIYVGKVINVYKDSGGIFKYAEVEPAVDFRRLEEVLVVKSFIP